MARNKIDYGIDLGTTNSAISRMEKGEPIVIKTDVLKDTMPSCISVNKKGSIKAGDSAYNTMKQDKRRATKSWHKGASNTYVEFKRTMATDTKYSCTNLNKDFSSEELSAEVLKTLKSFVTDETFSSVVITVPAKFTVNQKLQQWKPRSWQGSNIASYFRSLLQQLWHMVLLQRKSMDFGWFSTLEAELLMLPC